MLIFMSEPHWLRWIGRIFSAQSLDYQLFTVGGMGAVPVAIVSRGVLLNGCWWVLLFVCRVLRGWRGGYRLYRTLFRREFLRSCGCVGL